MEELKQRLSAQTAKLKRYQERGAQYRQNRIFESNQRSRFEELESVERDNTIRPDADESREFWNSVCGKSTEHNGNAEYL